MDLATLAGVAGVSIHHFARGFKQSAGVTPHHYLNQASRTRPRPAG
jgi:AraC-like DNA-binding protein